VAGAAHALTEAQWETGRAASRGPFFVADGRAAGRLAGGISLDYLDFIDTIQSITDGVLFGATYALLGIGFTLVFGVMHKINLSYAAASIGAAYASLIILGGFKAPPILFFALAAACGGVIGGLVYLIGFKFIPLANPLATLMSTLGLLLLIDEIVVHITQGVPLAYPALFSDVIIPAGPFNLRGDLIFVFALGCICMMLLLLLIYRTRLGIATRAVSQQPIASALCGISATRINVLTFVITGVLGGIAGAMIGAAIGMLSPLLALPLTVKGLIVSVIGGLGSIPGAILAGLLVGGLENFFQFWRGVSERDLYIMLLLFIFLVFRPGGFFTTAAGRD
jgi:branched-chain amino acid transport system permease protein